MTSIKQLKSTIKQQTSQLISGCLITEQLNNDYSEKLNTIIEEALKNLNTLISEINKTKKEDSAKKQIKDIYQKHSRAYIELNKQLDTILNKI